MKKVGLITLSFCIILFLCNYPLISSAQTEESLPTDCIICPQFVPECGPNEVLIPQTCEKCSHCEPLIPPEEQTTPQPETIEITPESSSSSTEQANCQKCTFHVDCPQGNKCVNDCCELKPKKQKKYANLKESSESTKTEEAKNPECIICTQAVPECKPNEKLIKQTCTKCSYCEIIKVIKKEVTSKTPTKKTIIAKSTSQIKTKLPEKKVEVKDIKCKMSCGSKCCKQGESCITLSQCKGQKKCNLPLLRICTKKKPEPLSGGAISF